jgi:hypothetical protein
MNFSRALILTFLPLAACNLSLRRNPTNVEPSKNIILAHFASTQYPLSDDNASSQLSEFFGEAVSALPGSNFSKWVSPPHICDYSGNFGVDVIAKRNLNLGALVLSHGAESVSLEASKVDFSWGATGHLSPGDYQIAPQGVHGTGAFTQTFSILPASGSILAYIGNLQAASFKLPSPQVPSAGNVDYDLHVSRSQPFILKITPSEHTDYYRVRIRDGSNRAAGDVLCYAGPTENIAIPPSLMGTFRTGGDGLLEIDQVHISHFRNQASVAESLIISSTRQVHGTIEYLDETNQMQRMQFGLLHIDP